jgi:hypothetical protein
VQIFDTEERRFQNFSFESGSNGVPKTSFWERPEAPLNNRTRKRAAE